MIESCVHLFVSSCNEQIDGVLAVHEFHVWQLAGDRIIASAHIRCHNLHDYMQIAEKVKEFFHNEGIHSTTIQPEFIDLENESEVSTTFILLLSMSISFLLMKRMTELPVFLQHEFFQGFCCERESCD